MGNALEDSTRFAAVQSLPTYLLPHFFGELIEALLPGHFLWDIYCAGCRSMAQQAKRNPYSSRSIHNNPSSFVQPSLPPPPALKKLRKSPKLIRSLRLL